MLQYLRNTNIFVASGKHGGVRYDGLYTTKYQITLYIIHVIRYIYRQTLSPGWEKLVTPITPT